MIGLVMLAVYIIAAIIVAIAGFMLLILVLAALSLAIELFFRFLLAIAALINSVCELTIRLATHLVTLARKVVTHARR